jgi:hypothetical protein
MLVLLVLGVTVTAIATVITMPVGFIVFSNGSVSVPEFAKGTVQDSLDYRRNTEEIHTPKVEDARISRQAAIQSNVPGNSSVVARAPLNRENTTNSSQVGVLALTEPTSNWLWVVRLLPFAIPCLLLAGGVTAYISARNHRRGSRPR